MISTGAAGAADRRGVERGPGGSSYAIQGCQGCTVVKVAPRKSGQEIEEKCQNGGQVEKYYHPVHQNIPSKSTVREWSDDVNGRMNKNGLFEPTLITHAENGTRCNHQHNPQCNTPYNTQNGGVLNGTMVTNGHGCHRAVKFDPGVWHSPQLANHRHRMKHSNDKSKSATLSPPTSRHNQRNKQNGGTENCSCKPLFGYKHVIMESPVKCASPTGNKSQGSGYEAAKRILSEKVDGKNSQNSQNSTSEQEKTMNRLGPTHSPMISRRDNEKGKKGKSPLAYSQRMSGYRLANGYVNVTITPPKVQTVELRIKEVTSSNPCEKRNTMCGAKSTCNLSTGYSTSTLKPAVPVRTSSLNNTSQQCHRSTSALDNTSIGSSTSSGADSAVDTGHTNSTMALNSTQNSTHNPNSNHRCSHTHTNGGCPLLAAQRWIQQQRKPVLQLQSPSSVSHSSLGFSQGFSQPVSPYGKPPEFPVSGSGADTSRDSGFVSITEDFLQDHHTYLYKGAEQVTHFCRLLHQPPVDTTAPSDQQIITGKPLSESQRLRKVIKELIETERQYVKDLNCLIERYLEPLKEETYLSGEDIEQLFGNIQEIVQFQRLFLQSLEDAVQIEPNFSETTDPNAFRDENLRRILFSLGGSFLYYANHFKLYSSFCAAHSKAQKVLNPEENEQLAEFLRARNPKQQHSATLESYLIKPIQRILKYPLLLKQLKDLTDNQSDEHQHLTEALRGMEAVAEHINEMQKIYEEYGNVFDDLIRLYKDSHRMAIDLNVGELQMYGNVNWLNALDELGKIKKGTELVTMLFVFKTGVVILAQERCKQKKQKGKPNSSSMSDSQGAGGIGEVIRFQAAIRVDQLQVRSVANETSERHGLWELVHCRSEKEGRPETIFQFASSQDAKRDFIKTIHNTIRESVRRMSIPGPRGNGTTTQQQQRQQSPNYQQQQSHPPHHIPNGGAGNKRPDTLPGNMISPGGGGGGQQQMSQSVGKKKGKLIRGDSSGIRHSMDIDDKMLEGTIGTRSRTLTDLNKMDLTDAGGYPSGSQSTIASEASRSSARLLHASNTPHNYTAQTSQSSTGSGGKEKDGPGSPIWKPRHASVGQGGTMKKTGATRQQQQPIGEEYGHHHPHPQHQHQQQQYNPNNPHYHPPHSQYLQQHSSPPVISGVSSAYSDYSNIVYDDKNTSASAASAAAAMMQHPNAYVAYEDTDC